MSKDNDIGKLRDLLFETLEGVKSGCTDLDRARSINEISKTLVDTARVEVEYLKTTGGQRAPFLESEEEEERPKLTGGRTMHRLVG